MSHELLFRIEDAEIASIIYVGDRPWHGYGIAHDGHLSALEAVAAIGSDYEIEMSPNYAREPGGAIVAVPAATLWRPPLPLYGIDTYEQFGQVSLDYAPISTVQIAHILDESGDDGESITKHWPVSTHGIICAGRKIFFTLDGGRFQVGKGNDVVRWVNILDEKTGKGAFTISIGATRVVCDNTFRLAQETARVSAEIRHVGDAADQAKNRLTMLRQAQEAMDEMEQSCKRMGLQSISDEDAELLAEKMYPVKRETARFRFASQCDAQGELGRQLFKDRYGLSLDRFLQSQSNDGENVLANRQGVLEAYASYNDDDGNEAHGSLWAFLQGATDYVDHVHVYKGEADARAVYAAFGKGDEAKSRAYGACLGALN